MSDEIFHHEKSGIGGFILMLFMIMFFGILFPIFFISILISNRQPLSSDTPFIDFSLISELLNMSTNTVLGISIGILFFILNGLLFFIALVVFAPKTHVFFESDGKYLIKRKSKGPFKILKTYLISDIDYLSSKSLTTVSNVGSANSGYTTRISTSHSISIVMKGKSFKEEVLLSDRNPSLIQRLAENLSSTLKVEIK